MSNLIKVAVIGAGMMGKNHLRTYKSLPGVELVGVYDIFGENAKKAAEKKPELIKAEPQVSTAQPTATDNEAIPGEVIAAIAAAVDAMYDKPVKIKSVRRSRANSGSSWRNAGLFENTKPF